MKRLALAFSLLCLSNVARAGLVSDKIAISEPGCRFPDVAYGKDRFLVVWADYGKRRVCGRFVRSDATTVGDSFCISDPVAKSALFPAVAYARAIDQFLVTWDDEGRGDVIHGQRIAGDGSMVGSNFAIGTVAGTIRSAVAWCDATQRWLVVYGAPITGSDVHGRLLDAAGIPIGGPLDLGVEPAFAGYPSVGCSSDRFLVTWDHDDGDIRSRTVDSKTGGLSDLRTVTVGGAKDRSQVAFDGVHNRFVVQFNDQSDKAFSYDQWARFVSFLGDPLAAAFPIAHTSEFEGDTQFGGDLAVLPTAQRMVSSYGTNTGIQAQELDLDGKTIGAPVVLGTGNYTSLSNAAEDPTARVLTAWEGLDPPDTAHRILVRVLETSRAVLPVPDAGVDASVVVDAKVEDAKAPLDAAPPSGDAAPLEGCACRATRASSPHGAAFALLILGARAARRRFAAARSRRPAS